MAVFRNQRRLAMAEVGKQAGMTIKFTIIEARMVEEAIELVSSGSGQRTY